MSRIVLTGGPGTGKSSIIEELEKRKKLLKVLNSPSNEEVYTSAALVEEMLDKLPVEIWKNKDLTWCDLCAKSGVFMLEVIIRLMKNIDIKDETLRHKWIINNMVKAYVNVERNKWMVSKFVYGNTDEVKRIGIIEDINKIKIEEMPKFDVVVGNPPYQGPKKESNKGQGSGNVIWQFFVELSFNILKDKGYICMIHPIHWRTDIGRKKLKTAQNLLFDNQIHFLKTFQTPFENIVTVVDWYIAQKTPKYKVTTIEFPNGIYEKYLKNLL